MNPDDLKTATEAIRERVQPIIFAVTRLDVDPFRDARLVADAALNALFSAGFTIVRKDA